MAKLRAALPTLLIEWAIFPFEMSAESPASFMNESVFFSITAKLRSEPHSTARSASERDFKGLGGDSGNLRVCWPRVKKDPRPIIP
jgi:hypothetical protein